MYDLNDKKGEASVKKILCSLAFILTIIVGNVTPIYAADSQVTTLKYEVNATVIFINDGVESLRQHIEPGKLVSEPSHLNKEGYRFVGWQDEETGEFWDFNNVVTRNMKLIAMYEKIPGWAKENNSANVTTSQGTNTGITSSQYFYFMIAGGTFLAIVWMIFDGNKRKKTA